MYSKRSVEGDGPDSMPVRTSDRLRSRPKSYKRTASYYSPPMTHSKRRKSKKRIAAVKVAANFVNKKMTSKENVLTIAYQFSFLLFVFHKF